MQWVSNSVDSIYLCLIGGSGQLLLVSMFLGKYLFTQILLYSFSRHLTDSSGSCLRNLLCTLSGLTAEWLDFFMETTSSVRVNGLLNSLELFEENLFFSFRGWV